MILFWFAARTEVHCSSLPIPFSTCWLGVEFKCCVFSPLSVFPILTRMVSQILSISYFTLRAISFFLCYRCSLWTSVTLSGHHIITYARCCPDIYTCHSRLSSVLWTWSLWETNPSGQQKRQDSSVNSLRLNTSSVNLNPGE